MKRIPKHCQPHRIASHRTAQNNEDSLLLFAFEVFGISVFIPFLLLFNDRFNVVVRSTLLCSSFGSGRQRLCVTLNHHLLVIYSLYSCLFVEATRFSLCIPGSHANSGDWPPKKKRAEHLEWKKRRRNKKKTIMIIIMTMMNDRSSFDWNETVRPLIEHSVSLLCGASIPFRCAHFLIYVTLFKQLMIRMEREFCSRCMVRVCWSRRRQQSAPIVSCTYRKWMEMIRARSLTWATLNGEEPRSKLPISKE